MEVAVAVSPNADMSLAGVSFGGFEGRQPVEALALVAVDVGPAAAQLGEFELMTLDEGVGENAPVAVAAGGDGVGAKDNRGSSGGEPPHRGGRRGAICKSGVGTWGSEAARRSVAACRPGGGG